MSRKLLKQARDLLQQHNGEWKYLADSGDAGNWKAEDRESYKKTEALIEQIDAALKPKNKE